MAGTGDPFLDEILARRSQFGLNTGGGGFDQWPDFTPPDAGFEPSTALAATATQELSNAQPQDAGGFSALNAIFDTLDVGGAFVRGNIGAFLSLFKGKFGEAGERFLSSFPGSETFAPLLGAGTGTAPTGEDLLVDLGMERGSTSEDEQRIRVARAAGMSEREARKKFTSGDKRLPLAAQSEFDELMRIVAESNPEFDFGVTWDDAKRAADLGDIAGIGVDIATDPLTYLSAGLTGAGKLAKAVQQAEKAAPGLRAALKAAKSTDEAIDIVRASKLPANQIGRLETLLGKGFSPGGELELGETFAEQAKRGQRGIANLGGRNLVRGQGAFDFLSKVNETAIARSVKGLPEGSRVQEALRSFYQPIKGAFSTKTGLADLDEAIATGKVAQRTGLTKAGRELDRITQQVREFAKAKNLTESEALGTVRTLVESGNFGKGELAPLAAGIAKINKEMADKSLRFHLPFQELDDATLEYLRREITPEGRAFLEKNGDKALSNFSGLEYTAKGSYLKARDEKWQGKTIAEINDYMRQKHGVKEFFHEDPLFATRRMVRQAQRAIGNAVLADEIGQRFAVKGGGTKHTMFDLMEKLGLKTDPAMKDSGIPEDIYKFAVRAREVLDKPGTLWKQYQAITNWMKSTVTVLFPGFHGRNMLENVFKNTLEGNVNPQNYIDAGKFLASAANVNAGGPGMLDSLARSAKAAFARHGEFTDDMKRLFGDAKVGDNLEDVIDWMHANGILENRISSELGAVLRDAPQGKPLAGAKDAFNTLFGSANPLLRTGTALASGTENWHRVSLFMDRLKKGFSATEAAEEVKRVFFDYRDLTQWESKYAKDFGFFYDFYRNNLRYITQEALSHPVRSKILSGAFQDDPDNPRFRWLSSKGALQLGAADVSLGFLPQQQFNMFNLAEGDILDKLKGKFGQAIGQANPLVSNALNLAYSKDLFTNTPLEYKTRVVDIGEAPEWFRDMVGYEQTADGNAKISHKWNFAITAVPAMARLMQSALAWDQKDKTYIEKLSRFLTGVGITPKTAEEMGKRDLELLNRNIEREGKSLPKIRSTGKAQFAVDTSTREGKVMGALATPSSAEIPTLLLDEQIAARIVPLISFKGDKPVMNKLLRETLDEIWHERYPEHAALFDAQRLRSKVKLSTKDNVDLEASEAFEQMFGE